MLDERSDCRSRSWVVSDQRFVPEELGQVQQFGLHCDIGRSMVRTQCLLVLLKEGNGCLECIQHGDNDVDVSDEDIESDGRWSIS